MHDSNGLSDTTDVVIKVLGGALMSYWLFPWLRVPIVILCFVGGVGALFYIWDHAEWEMPGRIIATIVISAPLASAVYFPARSCRSACQSGARPTTLSDDDRLDSAEEALAAGNIQRAGRKFTFVSRAARDSVRGTAFQISLTKARAKVCKEQDRIACEIAHQDSPIELHRGPAYADARQAAALERQGLTESPVLLAQGNIERARPQFTALDTLAAGSRGGLQGRMLMAEREAQLCINSARYVCAFKQLDIAEAMATKLGQKTQCNKTDVCESESSNRERLAQRRARYLESLDSHAKETAREAFAADHSGKIAALDNLALTWAIQAKITGVDTPPALTKKRIRSIKREKAWQAKQRRQEARANSQRKRRNRPRIKPQRGCCKYCDGGKPCGGSCIRADYTCRVGPGCAC